MFVYFLYSQIVVVQTIMEYQYDTLITLINTIARFFPQNIHLNLSFVVIGV
jgi:hypothetical protein